MSWSYFYQVQPCSTSHIASLKSRDEVLRQGIETWFRIQGVPEDDALES